MFFCYHVTYFSGVIITLPETKIAPENRWLEDAMSYWDGLFSGATLVSGSKGKIFKNYHRYHRFPLFHPHNMGNLMTPVILFGVW